MIRDAIVVGAGLSGLVCAQRLVAAGASVIVLEARDRVGGRLFSGRLAGSIVDLGGQWMSSGQPRLLALAQKLQLASFAEPQGGRSLLVEPRGGWFAQLARAYVQRRAQRQIMKQASAIPLGAPADAIDAAALDGKSVEDFLAQSIRNPIVRDRIALHADLVFAADSSSLSLLHYLATLNVTGGFGARAPELPGGGREHRFSHGAQALAERLSDGLEEIIQFDQQVLAIEDFGTAVSARTPTGSHLARRLVLALPPAMARGIDVALSPGLRRFADAARTGAVVKCYLAYDRPFWRDQGRSGQCYQPRGMVRATVEATAPDGAPALLAFVVGPSALAWGQREVSDRRAELLAHLVEQFGAAAATPIDVVEYDWGSDPWSGGCVASQPVGAISAGAQWRQPHGRIHLAGTESAVQWPGYMDGAIEAGERAAAEVLAQS
jgi:monoamine oxidase